MTEEPKGRRPVRIKGRGQNDQDIIRAIRYITDDRYIASYFGVDLKRVVYLRGEIKRSEPKPPAIQQVENGKPLYASNGLNSDSERRWNASAKEGSKALLKALNVFFEKRLLEKAAQERST